MTEYRKLRRQRAIVAGVCGGLGVFFGLNPGWFRLLFLLLLLPGGQHAVEFEFGELLDGGFVEHRRIPPLVLGDQW